MEELSNLPWRESNSKMITLEKIISYENMFKAMTQVIMNDGAPGIDGIPCADLKKVV